VAVNRETIQIQISGGDRIRDLDRALRDAARGVDELNQSLAGAEERLQALGAEQRAFTQGTRRLGTQARRARQLEMDLGSGAGASQAETAATRSSLRLRATAIRRELRERATERRRLEQRTRSAMEQSGVEETRRTELRRQFDNLIDAQGDYADQIRQNANEMARQLRQTRNRSAIRTTNTRRARYEEAIERLGTGAEFGDRPTSGLRQRFAEIRQSASLRSVELDRLEEAEAAVRSGAAARIRMLRGELASRRIMGEVGSGRQEPEARAVRDQINDILNEVAARSGGFQTTRARLVTEQGSLAERLREALRTGRGRREGFDFSRRLGERRDRLVAEQAIEPRTLDRVNSALERAGALRDAGDIETAKEVLKGAERTIAARERELKLQRNITREREGGLDAEVDRTNKLNSLQRKLNELRGGGARGFAIQRAEGLVARLPELEQAGNFGEFNRVSKQASDLLSATSSALTRQNKSTATISRFQKGIAKIEGKIAQNKQITLEEASRLQAFNEAQRRERGLGPAQLALPSGDPSLPRFRGGARPAGEGMIGRTAEEASTALREIQSDFIKKAAKPVGQKFVEALAEASTSAITGRGIFEAFQGFAKGFGKLATSQGAGGKAATGAIDPAEAQTRFNKALNSSRALTEQLNTLEVEGVNVAQERIKLEAALKATRKTNFELNRSSLEAIEDQLSNTRSFVSAERAVITQVAKRNKLEQDALDGQTARTNKLLGLQRKLGELTAAGVGGPALQRAQGLIGKLPGLEQGGNLGEFDRVAARASASLLDAASASRLQASASRDVAAADKARAAATKGAQDAEFKLRQLTTKGVDPRQLAAPVGGKTTSLQKIINRASSEAAFGDPARASELLDIANRRVEVLGRELGLAKSVESQEKKRVNASKAVTRENEKQSKAAVALASQREDALDAEVSRTLKLEKLERQLNELRAAGAKGVSFQRAEMFIGRLPALEQAGNFREFERAAKVSAEALAATRAGMAASKKAAGGAIDPAEAQTRLSKALNSSRVLQEQLNTLELKGVNVAQTKANLQNAINNAKQSTFQLTRDNLQELERELEAVRSLVAAEKSVTAEQEKQSKLRKISGENLPRIRRDTLSGLLGDIRESGGAGRVLMGGRSAEGAIEQIVQTFNRSVGTGATAGKAGQQLGLNDLAKVSKASTRELELLSETLTMVRAGMRTTDKGFDQIGDTIARVNRQIQRTDPDADFLTRRLGVRGGRAASEGLIGGAFPLLFGQGIGAAAGGAAGGALGGAAGGMLGFGLSLTGTAIGTAADNLMQAAQDTGDMLRDLTGNFDQIKEAGLLASRTQEKLVESLIQGGEKTAAYSIIQAELNRKLGGEGVSRLRAAADAGDRMKRAMAELGIQIQEAVSGPLAALLNWVSGVVEEGNKVNRYGLLLQQLPPERAQQLRQETLGAVAQAGQLNPFRVRSPLLGTQNLEPDEGEVARIATLGQLSAILAKFEAFVPSTPQTEEEKRSAAIREAEVEVSRAQRDLQAVSRELESIDILKGFEQRIVAAKREQEDIDRQAFEARRDYERQIADIRESVENRVSQINQENKQKEIDLIVKQGEIRQAQFRNAALAIQGELAGDELASSLADAVSTYLGAQLSAQDQIEQRRAQFELDLANQEIEIGKFKIDIAKSVSRLNLDTNEKIQAINLNIARRNEDAAKNTFEFEKKIASLKLKATTRELVLSRSQDEIDLEALRTRNASLPSNPVLDAQVKVLETRVAETRKATDEILGMIKEVEAMPPPAQIRPVAPISAKSVSTAGVDRAFARGVALSRQFQELEDQLVALVKAGDAQELVNQLDRIALTAGRQLATSLSDAVKEYGVAVGDLKPIIDGVDQSYEELRNSFARQKRPVTPELEKLLEGYRKAQIALEELAPTQRFYNDAISGYTGEIDQLKGSINDLLGPTSAYEKELQRINESGGIQVNPELNTRLLEAAANTDRLREKLEALNALNDLAAGWTDSFISFNKELLKGEGLIKSLKTFLESTADRALDLILEFTLRPMQEKMFKDMAKFLGFEAEKNPLLKPLDSINNLNEKIYTDLKAIKDHFLKNAPAALPVQPQAANGIVPGPGLSGIPASQQITQFSNLSPVSPVGPQSSGLPPNWNEGLGAGRGHQGRDVGVDVGTTIHAMEAAVVESIIRGFGKAGDAVVLRYANSDRLGVYGHMTPGVEAGQSVAAGQQIGVITPDIRPGGGNNSHLHYEWWKQQRGPAGNLLDPSDRLRKAIYGSPASMNRGPQSSLPGAFTGMGGPDELFAVEQVQGILPQVVKGAVENYERFKVAVEKDLNSLNSLKEVEGFGLDALDWVKNKAPLGAVGPAADKAMRSDMSEILVELVNNRMSQLSTAQQSMPSGEGSPLNGILKYEGQLSELGFTTIDLNGQFSKVGESVYQLDQKLLSASQSTEMWNASLGQSASTQERAGSTAERTANQESERLKKIGQFAGASIQTLSGVAMGIGGAQMIGKGGTYNTLMGIASIFGGISSVASGIGGFGNMFGLKGFADGGRPTPNEPAWIGEEGMELWVPDKPGTIISNDDLDDLYVPGLDDKNSPPVPAGRYSRKESGGFSSESDYDQSGAPLSYGRSVPYQRSETTREIDRLERVAANPRELPPIKYETQRVNQYEFVTPDQLEESNARTAKAARAQTIRELADSLKTRKRIGL
jgi:murein DD-endopeptidase MepM/ murein hydrolase activator NlpD